MVLHMPLPDWQGHKNPRRGVHANLKWRLIRETSHVKVLIFWCFSYELTEKGADENCPNENTLSKLICITVSFM